MAIYCIGDVHGCYRELQELLDLISPNLHTDELWFAGDMVGRGPDSLAVLRFVKELPRTAIVLGNHEFHLLALYYDVIHPTTHTLHEVLDANDCTDLIDWLRHQQLVHNDEGVAAGWTFAHAGIYPWWDLAQAHQYSNEVTEILRSNDCHSLFAGLVKIYGDKPDMWSEELSGWERWRFIINCFTRMRFCDATGRLDFCYQGKIGSQPAGYMPWFSVPQRKLQQHKIVFGHWAALAGKTTNDDNPNVFALDTGCVWGGALTAMRLEDRKLFQVKSKRTAISPV